MYGYADKATSHHLDWFLFYLFSYFFSFIALYRLHCCWNVFKHNIRIFNGREVRIENSVTKVTNCLASPGLPSDAEQLSRVKEFSIRTEQPLSIKKSSVRHLSYTLMSKRLKETDVKMTSRRQTDVKTVILTSCTRVVLHPSCKTKNPVGYARKIVLLSCFS